MSDINAVPPVGEPDTGASAPAAPVSSGSTPTPVDTPSSDQASIQTSAPIPSNDSSTTAPDGTQDDPGNVPCSSEPISNVASSTTDSGPADTAISSVAQSATTAVGTDALVGSNSGNVQQGADATASAMAPATPVADAPVTLNPITPTVTDSVSGNPTGGPTAGAGATPAAREKHGLIETIEEDLRAELAYVEALPEHVLHVLEAVFGRHHSKVDTDAA